MVIPTSIKKEAHDIVCRYLNSKGIDNYSVLISIIETPRPSKTPTGDYIIEFVCNRYGVNPEDVLVKSRKDKVRLIRQIIQYFMYKYCKMSHI